MRFPGRSFVALIALLFGAGVPARANEPATPGALRVVQKDGTLVDMPLRHTKVSIEVTAFLARTTVEQVFQNPFDKPVEAVYTFPLGDRAAVDDFELTVGTRTIRGEIKRREEARQVYEAARASGYQAALLEQERPNIFTQSVANLEPGKQVTVRLRTVETLKYERGTYRLAFPLVVGPRYIPGGRVADAARIATPPLRPGTRSGHDVEIAVSIDAGVPLREPVSPSHKIGVQRASGTCVRIELADADTIPNKDFQLRWSVSSERPATGVLTHRDGLDGFFTLLVQPKGEITPLEAMPKEIMLVVDTSGSMSGIPIEASKRFIAKALREMGPRDTFNVIRFAGDNTIFSKTPLPNTPSEVERAIAWVNAQQGGGGTELLAAMRAAFAPPPDPNRVRVVVFLTDGYIGNEAEILTDIGRVLGEARIYTVGIGASVNRYLLDRMADLGRGAFVAIRADETTDDAIEAFRSWVTKPYLTDLTVDWGALPIADVTPERIGDLGSGQTLTIVGRYLAAGSGDVVVRGRLGGRFWEQRLRVNLPERETAHDALASVWARARIEELMLVNPSAVSDATRAEVTSLALSYRLMSAYTSFVAVDDSVVVNPGGQASTIHQALPVPEGVSFEGVFGSGGPEGWRNERNDALEVQLDASKVDRVVVVSGGKAVEYGRAQDAFAKRASVAKQASEPPPASPTQAKPAEAKFSSEFITDLPVAGRFYQNVLSLAPGASSPPVAQRSNVSGARERDFKTSVGGISSLERAASRGDQPEERVREAAVRVLADLADDGKLSDAEGRPALAALLAAQVDSGAVSGDVITHALATWALDQAAQALPKDTWVSTARTKAVDYLASLATPGGWPGWPGQAIEPEATRWARLVMGMTRPVVVAAIPMPPGEPSNEYKRLRDAIAGARSGKAAAPAAGHDPFDRLVATIGRGFLGS